MKKIAAYLFFFTLAISGSFCQSKVKAKQGILDLREWNFTRNGLTDLNGEWEFYWRVLYTPQSFDTLAIKPSTFSNIPAFWNKLIPGKGIFEPGFGYATYKLKVLLPESNDKLALKFLTIASAYKLFINGKETLNLGKVGTNSITSIPDYRPVIVPVISENNQLDIVIQVSNFNYVTGGLWDFIKIGTEQQVNSYWLKNILWDFFIAGSFALIGIFYLVIYFFFRRRKGPLYFALFCFLVAIRPLVTVELPIMYVTNWNWQFIKHTEFLFLYLSVPILALFSYELFYQEFSRKILKYILIISAPFVAAAIFASPFIFSYILTPFKIFMVVTAFYGLYIYTKAVKNKRVGSVYFFVGFIILFLTIINDLLYSSLIIDTTNLIYIGLFIFVICQAASLSRQFFWTFSRLEILNKKLLSINDELVLKNKTINETNNQLSKLNAELDSIVFKTSHDLRSPITSVTALIHIIKEETDASKRNQYLELQRKTIVKLDSLITDILDFSRNKRTELTYTPINFEVFINNALQYHLFSEQSENIEKTTEINQQGLFVTDEKRLGMIINNLISNALKYHNINQDQPYLKIVVNASDKQAQIEVIDNGQGIDEQHLENIFTMFYRANDDLAGSGLGLYIVKEAVDKLNGTIALESEINKGTKFTIVIPNNIDKFA
jgi:two-component system sensor histidine kinase ChiS